MKVALRILILLLVFLGFGWVAFREVIRYASNNSHTAGATMPEVTLAGETAGLFAGGAATLIVGIAMAWSRKKF